MGTSGKRVQRRRKKKKQRKRAVICLVLCIAVIVLASVIIIHFSSADYDENTIVLGNFGRITEYMTEDFPQDTYSKDHFKTYMQAQIDDYCDKHDNHAVQLKSFSLKNDTLKIIINYHSDEDYALFNGVIFKWIKDFDLAKEDLKEMSDIQITDTQGNTQTLDSIDKSQYNVVMTDYAVDIIVPEDIAYISSNVHLKDERCAASAEGLSVIFYKK